MQKFVLFTAFSGVILILLLLVGGHFGLAIKITTYVYVLLVVIAVGGLLYNDHK